MSTLVCSLAPHVSWNKRTHPNAHSVKCNCICNTKPIYRWREREAPNYTKEHIKKLKINKGLREICWAHFQQQPGSYSAITSDGSVCGEGVSV